MLALPISVAAVLASLVSVIGASAVRRQELENTISQVEIHSSCDETARSELMVALNETYELIHLARDYILEKGGKDELYRTYFGSGDAQVPINILGGIISGSKDGVLLRCDDPDQNCAGNPTWAGHWRGENATTETVICPLSFTLRLDNDEFCTGNYTIAQSNVNTFWSTDLLHRLSHVPNITVGVLDHYADAYADCLELAKNDPTTAPYNTHSLQYFAADVYARTVAAPPAGCIGTISAPAASTKTAASPCHTHADGEVHCSNHEETKSADGAVETQPSDEGIRTFNNVVVGLGLASIVASAVLLN